MDGWVDGCTVFGGVCGRWDGCHGCMGWLDGRVGWWVRVGGMMDRVGGCMSWVDGSTDRLGMKRVGGHQVVGGYVGWVDGCARRIECETGTGHQVS